MGTFPREALLQDSHYEKPDVKGFQRKAETARIDCGRLLHEEELGNYTRLMASSRTRLRDQNVSMTCEDVQARVLPPNPLNRLHFGIAYARIVYESYDFIEDELRSSYHPQNFFCYAIDYKAKREFAERIEGLAKCLSNVVVPTKRFDIGRAGINGTRAHYECMKSLMVYKGWGYVILMQVFHINLDIAVNLCSVQTDLQNYDIMIKTVYEAVDILRALGGANDVHVRPCESNRYNHSLKWDVRSLKFFRNETQMTPTQLNASLVFARGAVHASLSRAAADWMVNTVDLTKTFEQLDRKV
ncbi:Core-2/I-Branching enzyme [Ostertagia ostertagi]